MIPDLQQQVSEFQKQKLDLENHLREAAAKDNGKCRFPPASECICGCLPHCGAGRWGMVGRRLVGQLTESRGTKGQNCCCRPSWGFKREPNPGGGRPVYGFAFPLHLQFRGLLFAFAVDFMPQLMFWFLFWLAFQVFTGLIGFSVLSLYFIYFVFFVLYLYLV